MRKFENLKTQELMEVIPGELGLVFAHDRDELRPVLHGIKEPSALDHIVEMGGDDNTGFFGIYVNPLRCIGFGFTYDPDNRIVYLPRASLAIDAEKEPVSADEFTEPFLQRLVDTNRVIALNDDR